MSDKTKAVNLTEDEIVCVISKYGYKLGSRNYTDEDIDRINYLNKRLKAFKEVEIDTSDQQFKADAKEIKSNNSTAGWDTK